MSSSWYFSEELPQLITRIFTTDYPLFFISTHFLSVFRLLSLWLFEVFFFKHSFRFQEGLALGYFLFILPRKEVFLPFFPLPFSFLLDFLSLS